MSRSTCAAFVRSLGISVSLAAISLCCMFSKAAADEKKSVNSQKPEAAEIKSLILPGEAFLVKDHPAFILWPKEELRTEPQPWVFYAPTLPAYPDVHEKWMHEQFLNAGVAVAGIDAGEAYGSPDARQLFDAFYDVVTVEKGLSKTPCLLGRSRGGLWVSSWACDHPERFSGMAGIYPVFDFRTYPGVDKAAPAYGVSVEELVERNNEFNPIARATVIAKAKLPVFIIHGDEDTVVPLKENSQTLFETYKRENAESSVTLLIAKGQGHNYWEGFFRCQQLIDFVIFHAKHGREAK